MRAECAPVCVEKKKCHMFSGLGNKMHCGFNSLCCKLKPKPKCYTYEWCLKKKRVWGCHGDCGQPSCDTCGIYPSGQGAPRGITLSTAIDAIAPPRSEMDLGICTSR